jgi:DNA anti-recombination protein RmuC
VAHNTAIIRELGQELYRRLGNFTSHLGRAGARLGAAVEAYNAAVGSLERQVLPQARRFTELGVTADSPIAALDSVDALARVPLTTPTPSDVAVSETDVEAPATRSMNGASNAAAASDPNAPAHAKTSGSDSTASGQSDACNT